MKVVNKKLIVNFVTFLMMAKSINFDTRLVRYVQKIIASLIFLFSHRGGTNIMRSIEHESWKVVIIKVIGNIVSFPSIPNHLISITDKCDTIEIVLSNMKLLIFK